MTVRQGKFVITNPDLTSAGAHYCVAAGSDSSKTTSRKRAATFELSAPPSVHTATSVKISVANGGPIAKRPRTQDAAKPPVGQQVNEPSEGNRGPTACRVTAPDASEQKPADLLGSSCRLSEHSRRSFTNSATSISNDFYSEPSLANRPKLEPREVVTLSGESQLAFGKMLKWGYREENEETSTKFQKYLNLNFIELPSIYPYVPLSFLQVTTGAR